jgi:hypothetical protein
LRLAFRFASANLTRIGRSDFALRQTFVKCACVPALNPLKAPLNMYVVAIGWLYVLVLVAVTQPTVTRAVLTFVFAGLAPLALWLWLVGTPQRRRNQARERALREQSERSASVDPDQ